MGRTKAEAHSARPDHLYAYYRPVSAVTLTKRTLEVVDELLPLWQKTTKTEDAAALVARSIVDCLLDLKVYVAEFDAFDLEDRVKAK